MFTGIVEKLGLIESVSRTPSGARIAIRASEFWHDVPHGASIAVDGVCLTAVRTSGDLTEFDAVAETLARTTIGNATSGRRVNLEKSLRPTSRLDGHFVQGHVDYIGKVKRIDRSDGEERWWFEVAGEMARLLIPKGSIAIDGVSLTICDVEPGAFSVVLIPTTLGITTFGHRRVGDCVNLESDIITRTVVATIERMAENGTAPRGLTVEQVVAAGFGATAG